MRRKQDSLILRTSGFLVMLLWFAAAAPAIAQLPTSQFEAIFPAGAAPGSTLDVTIAGKNLDDTAALLFSHDGIKAQSKMAEPTQFDEKPKPVENIFTLTVGKNVPAGRYEVRSQGKYGLSNPRAFAVGTLPELVEVEPNGGNELPAWKEVDDGSGGTASASVTVTIQEFVSETVAGYVYIDSNANGLRDLTDSGVSGVSVELSGTDRSGNLPVIHYQF